MASRPTRRTADEVRALGEGIYERDIRLKVEPGHLGEIIAIDVGSGEYAIAKTTRAAADRLRERLPDAELWMVRAGYRTVHSFGAGLQRRAE